MILNNQNKINVRRISKIPVLFLLVVYVALPTTVSAATPLTWAPPADYKSYTPFTIPASGGEIIFPSDTTDYIIVAPKTIKAAVVLKGGRNIVWIGGHIQINKESFSTPKPRAISRRALAIADNPETSIVGREVHIEGLLIDGNDLSEGIDTACPSARVTLQNVRIDQVRLRGCDDRDGTGGYNTSHPDIVQTWGSHNGLRVDGLTGSSNYQGLFLKEDVKNAKHANVYFRRINVQAISFPDEADPSYSHAGHAMIALYKNKSGQLFVDNGTVWVTHHPDSGWAPKSGGFKKSLYRDRKTGELIPQPVKGSATFANAFLGGYPAKPTIEKDALGTFIYWTDWITDGKPAIRNWDNTGFGKFYSGRPPEGDYVPVDMAGLKYVSPGYKPQDSSNIAK